MKLSMHPQSGKAPKGQEKIMGAGWRNIEASWREVFEMITTAGFATSAELTEERRLNANFKSRQLVMIDIDNDPDKDLPFMTIDELLADEFYNQFGAGFYATQSFRPERHKFRICFVLENPITDAQEMRWLVSSMLKVYPAGDRACTDPVRLFYGSPNCELCECRDNTLPQAIVDAFIDERRQEYLARQTQIANTEPPKPGEVSTLLDDLKGHYADLEYDRRRDVTWAVMGAVGAQEAISQMRSRWYDGDKTYKYEQFVDDFQTAGIGLGSIVHMIRERDPLYRKSLKRVSLAELKAAAEKFRKQKNEQRNRIRT